MIRPASDRVEKALRAIEAAEPRLRAFLTLTGKEAIAAAAALDAAPPGPAQPLQGVTTAVKDLTDVAGVRTTFGSLLYAERIAQEDDLIVSRLRRAGALILGKTMTPEFGFGAICGNRLGGPTANPWDLSLTSGGSSGGSAAAVAAGLVELGHGTDFGGSVRTPAGFCGVASIRPTPGLLPNPRRSLGFDLLATTGFMARDVAMLERALRATAGPDARDPLSLRAQADPDAGTGDALRIAATEDFGAAPVAREVRGLMREAAESLPACFGKVGWTHPDCADAFAIFHVLRPALIRHDFGPLLAKHGDDLTQTVRWWIERGAGISAETYLGAEAARTALARRFVAFFERFDVLLAPAASVMPWPNAVPEVTEIDGAALETIADYLAVTFFVSLAGCPVVTLPAPRPAGALPFGIQLIGAPGSDLRLLAIAQRFEAEAGWRYRPPPLVA
jgi:amidase